MLSPSLQSFSISPLHFSLSLSLSLSSPMAVAFPQNITEVAEAHKVCRIPVRRGGQREIYGERCLQKEQKQEEGEGESIRTGYEVERVE